MTPLQVLHTRLTRSEIVLSTAAEGLRSNLGELYDGSIWVEDINQVADLVGRVKEKYLLPDVGVQNTVRQLSEKTAELSNTLEAAKTVVEGRQWFRIDKHQIRMLLIGFRIMKRGVELLDQVTGGESRALITRLTSELESLERRTIERLQWGVSLPLDLSFSGKTLRVELDIRDSVAPKIRLSFPGPFLTCKPQRIGLASLSLEERQMVLTKILAKIGLPSEES